MRKTIAMFLALAVVLSCAVVLTPAPARADSVYIIPDSDTRLLTEEELWGYQYDTLLFAFNEIYARHGYKFETGSRCYNWFTQMPWYTPNANENSKDHHATYSQCSKIENANVDLIKKVRKDMKAAGTLNPSGKGMPTPPSRDLQAMRGFTGVKLQGGQKLDVYSAPTIASYRAANGKASVSTNGAVYAMGEENGWMLVMYETNSGQARIGYVNKASIKGQKPSLPQLSFARVTCTLLANVGLTDDPARTGKPLAQLSEGTQVIYLTTMYNSGAWDYIETYINGQITRGFVPAGTLDIGDTQALDAVDAMELMDGNG